MPSRPLPISELKALPWSDAVLNSISWTNANRDLRITVSLGDGRAAAFDFCWADKLRVDLAYPERENYPPMTWEVVSSAGRDARHGVLFDLAKHGSIALEFESATVDGI